MSEAVGTTHRQAPVPLTAARMRGARRGRGGPWLACLLLSAAACAPPADTERVIIPTIFAGVSGGSGVPAPSAGAAGRSGPPPGTAGGMQTGTAGGGGPVGASGTGVVGPGPTAGGASGTPPIAGSGSVQPMPDGGLPAYDAGTEPDRNTVRAGQLCARVSALQCAAEQHCCTTAKNSFDACKTQLTKTCMDNAFLDEIAMNNVAGYSQTQTKATFDQIEVFGANCDPTVTMWAAQPEGLRAMFQGTVAPGGMCKPTGLPSQGSYAASLASCTNAETTSCLFSGTGPTAPPQTATCAARGDSGATCFLDVNCKDGMYCQNPQMKYSSGKCAALNQNGATCTLDSECASFTCRSAVCVAATADTTFCVSK
jgi:Dickkopf N-terminal cysteine-rich region